MGWAGSQTEDNSETSVMRAGLRSHLRLESGHEECLHLVVGLHIIPHLQTREPRIREGEHLTQGHTAW